VRGSVGWLGHLVHHTVLQLNRFFTKFRFLSDTRAGSLSEAIVNEEIFEGAAGTSDGVEESTETAIAREEIESSPKRARGEGSVVLRFQIDFIQSN
jgi:hypothetical protein